MSELFLVRHGQASFGAADYDQLSALGEQQALWLGEHFASLGVAFDAVVIGTMKRHRQTADAIGRGMGNAPAYEEDAGLNEYDFDALFAALGDEHADIKALASGGKRDYYRGLKQVLHLWSTDRLGPTLPETWAQFQARVSIARASIQRRRARRVLVVSSGGVIAAHAQQVLQAPAATAIALNLQVRNSSVSHYFFNAESMQLASFNAIPHLDRPGRLDSITYG